MAPQRLLGQRYHPGRLPFVSAVVLMGHAMPRPGVEPATTISSSTASTAGAGVGAGAGGASGLGLGLGGTLQALSTPSGALATPHTSVVRMLPFAMGEEAPCTPRAVEPECGDSAAQLRYCRAPLDAARGGCLGTLALAMYIALLFDPPPLTHTRTTYTLSASAAWFFVFVRGTVSR